MKPIDLENSNFPDDQTVQEVTPILIGPEVNRFNRFNTFLKVADNLSDRAYWWGLRNAYVATDGLWKIRGQVRECFRSDRPEKEYLMFPEERDYLESLPEKASVYRAMSLAEATSTDFGLSWTFNAERAKWYRDDYLGGKVEKRVIFPLEIISRDIIAYLGAGNEDEVIIDLSISSNNIPEEHFYER